MPAKYDLTKVEANFDHGTLTLRVPRSEAAQKRTVQVRTGGQLNAPKTVDAGQSTPATSDTPATETQNAGADQGV